MRPGTAVPAVPGAACSGRGVASGLLAFTIRSYPTPPTAPEVIHRPRFPQAPVSAGPGFQAPCPGCLRVLRCYMLCCAWAADTSRTHGVFASARLLFWTSQVP
ncbi:hypothetical protein GCM10010255_47320 [Streptomyces coeruleofuscus]|uniref:Secreted protein n=1 Tax=Streptomyces coeruleofuscus TaxID=66879 RepID=A0ABN3ILS8_9ACTN